MVSLYSPTLLFWCDMLLPRTETIDSKKLRFWKYGHLVWYLNRNTKRDKKMSERLRETSRNFVLWLAWDLLLDFVQLEPILIAEVVDFLVYFLDGDFHFVGNRLNRRYSLITIFVFAKIFIPQALVDFVQRNQVLRLLPSPVVLRHLRAFSRQFDALVWLDARRKKRHEMYETQNL